MLTWFWPCTLIEPSFMVFAEQNWPWSNLYPHNILLSCHQPAFLWYCDEGLSEVPSSRTRPDASLVCCKVYPNHGSDILDSAPETPWRLHTIWEDLTNLRYEYRTTLSAEYVLVNVWFFYFRPNLINTSRLTILKYKNKTCHIIKVKWRVFTL